MKTDLIYIEGVTVNFNGFKALNNVNFVVHKGELRFLIGPNGAGKTTLLDVMCGKVRPVSGKVYFNNTIDVLTLNEYMITRNGISRKFQTPSVFENLSVFENMEIALKIDKQIFSSLFYKATQIENEKIYSILKKVGLEEKTTQKARTLAHGEKQWLELAMTLIQDPKLLLVDEPVAGMTCKEREKTGKMLTEIAKERSVIIVEHDMNFVEQFSNIITVLHEGRILCEGNFDKIKNDSIVIEVYLGREGGKGNVLN